jgi:hypothetical protein
MAELWYPSAVLEWWQIPGDCARLPASRSLLWAAVCLPLSTEANRSPSLKEKSSHDFHTSPGFHADSRRHL